MFNIPGYTIFEPLADTGYFRLYRATTAADALPCFIKTAGEQWATRFNEEWLHYEWTLLESMSPGSSLRPIDRAVSSDGLHALVLEGTSGCTLERRLADPSISLVQKVRLAASLADCIAHFHRQRIALRALHPARFWVKESHARIQLVDGCLCTHFDAAHPFLQPFDIPDSLLPYISPEQTGRMEGSPDYRSDFYSFGVLLYEGLSRRKPFGNDDASTIVYRHLAEKPLSLHQIDSAIPKPLSALVDRCLSKDPFARYASAYELKADLERCLQLVQEGRASGGATIIPLKSASGRLNISEQLFGREAERQLLLDAISRARSEGIEVVCVTGGGGIGKTSFVRDTLPAAARPNGFWASGAMRIRQGAAPYDIWMQAVDELTSQLLMLPRIQAEVWRLQILKALEGYGRLLVERVPKLERLIGEQPDVEPLPATEAKHRFHQLLTRFLHLFMQESSLLVLFLDDIHEADEASLQYLDYLLEASPSHHLLLVLASRLEAASGEQNFERLLSRLHSLPLPVVTIELQPLTQEDVLQLIHHSIDHHPGDGEVLAKLLLHKSGGNPFWLKQMLHHAVSEQLALYNEDNHAWQWDLDRLIEWNLLGNTEQYLSGKLRQLPENTRLAIGRAAFLGSSFAHDTLMAISGMTATELNAALQTAIDKGFLFVTRDSGNRTYRFLHSYIQDEAYRLVAEPERGELHLRIGSFLAAILPEQHDSAKRNSMLFEAIDHLNRAFVLTGVPTDDLPQLNWQAGASAKQSTDYSSALHYLRFAADLLGPDPWTRQYSLAFSIHSTLAEMEFVCGNTEAARPLFQALLDNAASSLDQARICTLQIQLESSRDNYRKATELCAHVLRLLNVKCNLASNAFQLMLKHMRLKRKLRGRPIESLTQLPPLSDEKGLLAVQALSQAGDALYATDRNSWLAAMLAIVDISLEEGIAPDSAIGFVGYALFINHVYRNNEDVYHWGKLAMQLSRPYPILYARTLTAFSLCFESWHIYEPSLIDTFTVYANRAGLETGSLWHGNRSVMINSLIQFLTGKPLEAIHGQLLRFSANFGKQRNHLNDMLYPLLRTLLERLMHEREAAMPFSHDLRDEEPIDHQSVLDEDTLLINQMRYYTRYLIGYLLGDYEEANAALEQNAGLLQKLKHDREYTLQYVFEVLVWAKWFDRFSPGKQRSLLRKMKHRLRWAKAYAKRCAPNYMHKYWLIKAEIARVEHKYSLAESCYEQSIQYARHYGYVHDAAIAEECFAACALQRGKLRAAKIHLLEACATYKQWGAFAKVSMLEQTHRHLLQVHSPSGLENIDSLSLVQAGQAISGEMELNSLLDKLLLIMLHNAGAEYGAVILHRHEGWTVEASGTLEERHVAPAVLDERNNMVPASIIAYATRTREEIVLHNAQEDGMFIYNEFVRSRGLRSVLCMPIIHQNEWIGLIYMENRLASGIFTDSKLEMLRLLGTQCAISLANARLFADNQFLQRNLEQQVAERTRSLEISMRETSAALAEMSIYEERNRIAQEIHDIVGHTLTSMILQIEVGKRLISKNPEAGLSHINEAQSLVRQSLNEIRKSVHMLREDHNKELASMLRELIGQTERSTCVHVHVDIGALPPLLTTGFKKTIYHALQEGLTNGMRHGGSASFDFSLQQAGSMLQFRLKDYGTGCDNIVTGFGLKMMKERVEQMGGGLSISGIPSEGCLLSIDLPLPKLKMGESE